MPAVESPAPDVDVVVVSWNSRNWLPACLGSIFASQAKGFRFGKTIVVDNASLDGSADAVSQGFGRGVKVMRNSRNEGFGKACNLGASQGTAKYILFLNPDAELGVSSVENAVRFLEDMVNADVGACGVRLVDRGGASARTCARRPTPVMFLASAIGLHRLVRMPSLTYVMTDFDHQSDKFVDHVIGAMYLVRRKLFEELGGFDERFFVYLEDLDLSMRIRDSGHRIAFIAEHPAFHEGGGVSKSVMDKRLFYSLDSRLRYARKHFSLIGAALVWASTLAVEPIVRVAVALSTGQAGSVMHTARAYRWLYSSVLGFIRPIDISEARSRR